MRKKIALLSLGLMPIAIASALALSPVTGGQQSERGQCEQDCNTAFKACNVAPNANRANCSTQYKACRDLCKKEKPSPSPNNNSGPETSPSPDVSPSPEVSPSPSPDVSPSPSPDGTPSGTPSPSPTPPMGW